MVKTDKHCPSDKYRHLSKKRKKYKKPLILPLQCYYQAWPNKKIRVHLLNNLSNRCADVCPLMEHHVFRHHVNVMGFKRAENFFKCINSIGRKIEKLFFELENCTCENYIIIFNNFEEIRYFMKIWRTRQPWDSFSNLRGDKNQSNSIWSIHFLLRCLGNSCWGTDFKFLVEELLRFKIATQLKIFWILNCLKALPGAQMA